MKIQYKTHTLADLARFCKIEESVSLKDLTRIIAQSDACDARRLRLRIAAFQWHAILQGSAILQGKPIPILDLQAD